MKFSTQGEDLDNHGVQNPLREFKCHCSEELCRNYMVYVEGPKKDEVILDVESSLNLTKFQIRLALNKISERLPIDHHPSDPHTTRTRPSPRAANPSPIHLPTMSEEGEDLQWRKFTWSTAGFDARSPPHPSTFVFRMTDSLLDFRIRIRFVCGIHLYGRID